MLADYFDVLPLITLVLAAIGVWEELSPPSRVDKTPMGQPTHDRQQGSFLSRKPPPNGSDFWFDSTCRTDVHDRSLVESMRGGQSASGWGSLLRASDHAPVNWISTRRTITRRHYL
jgi:hypothetical protein